MGVGDNYTSWGYCLRRQKLFRSHNDQAQDVATAEQRAAALAASGSGTGSRGRRGGHSQAPRSGSSSYGPLSGRQYSRQEVVACAVDLDAGTISYWSKGEDMGPAFVNVGKDVQRGAGQAFFPAVSFSRDIAARFNFGNDPSRPLQHAALAKRLGYRPVADAVPGGAAPPTTVGKLVGSSAFSQQSQPSYGGLGWGSSGGGKVKKKHHHHHNQKLGGSSSQTSQVEQTPGRVAGIPRAPGATDHMPSMLDLSNESVQSARRAI